MEKINLADKFALFDDHWSPKVAGQLDDYEIKLVKLEGDFVWHKHDDVDEMFMVIDGTMDVAFRDKTVTLEAGEFLVVPKGVEHKPYAEHECSAMLFERKGVINTGNASEGDLTQRQVERI